MSPFPATGSRGMITRRAGRAAAGRGVSFPGRGGNTNPRFLVCGTPDRSGRAVGFWGLVWRGVGLRLGVAAGALGSRSKPVHCT